MRKITLSFLLTMLTVGIIHAQDVQLAWAKSMGGNGGNKGLSIALDASGNVYTTGYFTDTIDFDPGSAIYNLTSPGNLDIYIQKLDSSGNFIWAKSMGGSDYDCGLSITLDASGNVYTTGYFRGLADFDPGSGVYNLTSTGDQGQDIFIQKLDSSGNFIWAKSMGGGYADIPYSTSLDASGNIYTTGSFIDTADFDPGSGVYNLTSTGIQDIFIQKLDSSGSFIWAKSIGGVLFDEGFSIILDDSGNIYTTGAFYDTVDFDSDDTTYNLTSAGSYDIFIQKMNSSGNFIWAKSVGGSNSDKGYSIIIDDSGDIYTTGIFRDTVDFDPGNGTYDLISNGYQDIFIQKLDSSGNFIWAKSMGGSNSDEGASISLDTSGSIYTTGFFKDTVDFDPGNGIYNLISPGNRDIFIQKLDPSGNFIWAKSMGAFFDDEGFSITLDASGNVYTTGHFRGPADFDPGNGTYYLSSTGNRGIFIQKLKPAIPISYTTATKDSKIKLSVSPNPNNGSFTLIIDNSYTKTNETYLIEIYDVIGNLLHREEIRGERSVISNMHMENLSKGMYFLSLKTKGKQLTSRFVVQ